MFTKPISDARASSMWACRPVHRSVFSRTRCVWVILQRFRKSSYRRFPRSKFLTRCAKELLQKVSQTECPHNLRAHSSASWSVINLEPAPAGIAAKVFTLTSAQIVVIRPAPRSATHRPNCALNSAAWQGFALAMKIMNPPPWFTTTSPAVLVRSLLIATGAFIAFGCFIAVFIAFFIAIGAFGAT